MADDIKTIIEEQIKRFEYFGHPAIMERFVLRNGKEGIGKPRPPGISKRPDKECFKNSSYWAVEVPGWTYTEGFAIRPSLGMLIHHAWLENKKGEVLDLTWKDPQDCLYYGVRFSTVELVENMVRTKVYGILMQYDIIDVDVIFKRDPELRAIVHDVIATRKAGKSPIQQMEQRA